jgi:hypothetical protein
MWVVFSFTKQCFVCNKPTINFCAQLQPYRRVQKIIVLSHWHKTQLHFSAMWFFKWNTSVTCHKNVESAFPITDACQGQMQTAQSVWLACYTSMCLQGIKQRKAKSFGKFAIQFVDINHIFSLELLLSSRLKISGRLRFYLPPIMNTVFTNFPARHPSCVV